MPGSNGHSPVLAFDRVVVDFGQERALNEVSLSVGEGDTYIVLGAAGSGKTTLLKTAIHLVRPDSGVVRLFGQEITGRREIDLVEPRSRVGILFQEGGLFDSLTIEENVAYPLLNQKCLHCPLDQVRPRVEEALRFVELEHTLDKFPSELSGGMRRRVGIARATVTEPALVLYDSPTAGLDPITANTIMALIIKARDLKRTTTMIVTHRFQDGELMAKFRYNPNTGALQAAGGHHEPANRTRFLVLQEGLIVFEGTLDQLAASQDPYTSRFVRR